MKCLDGKTKRTWFSVLLKAQLVLSVCFFGIFQQITSVFAQEISVPDTNLSSFKEESPVVPLQTGVCESPFVLASNRDTLELDPSSAVVLANDIKRIQKNIACLKVSTPGFYRFLLEVVYSPAFKNQDNETYFLDICDERLKECTNPCDPNAAITKNILFKVIVKDSKLFIDPVKSTKAIRHSGVFFLKPGKHVVRLNHFKLLEKELPEFVIPPGDTISGPNSVHISKIIIEKTSLNYDLTVKKTASKDSVAINNSVKFSVTISNVGTAKAHKFFLRETFPAVLVPQDFKIIFPPSQSQEPLSGRLDDLSAFDLIEVRPDTIFWKFDSLAPGETLQIEYSAQVDSLLPENPFKIINFSQIFAPCDSNQFNDRDSVQVIAFIPPPNFDLQLKKTVNPDTVLQGKVFTYTLQMVNWGPHLAKDFQVRDVVPDSIELLTFNPLPDTTIQDTLIWNFAQLEVGDTLGISYSAKVNDTLELDQAFFMRKNFALVQADLDTNASNDSASAKVVIKRLSKNYDLKVSKNAEPDTILQGKPFTFALTLVNLGPKLASNVIVQDVLPDSVQILNFLFQPPDTTRLDTLLWNLSQLAPGDSVRFDFTAFVPDTFELNRDLNLKNIVFVEAEFDTNAVNNQDSVSVLIRHLTRNYDLALTKSVQPDTVLQGRFTDFKLKLVHLGPKIAENITLYDVLPPIAKIVEFTQLPPDTMTMDTLVWNIDRMEPGDSLQIGYRFQVPDTLDLQDYLIKLINNAFFHAERDTNHANDFTMATLYIRKLSRNYDLSLSKEVDPDTVLLGKPFTFTLTLTNLGPQPAENVFVRDVIPPYIEIIKFMDPQPILSNQDSLLWNFPILNPGDSLTMGFTARVPDTLEFSSEFLPLKNLALIEAERDTNSVNDTPKVFVYIRKPSKNYDLAIHKSVQPDTVAQGDIFNYTLQLVNLGPKVAENVQLVDLLPDPVVQVAFGGLPPRKVQGDSLIWTFDSILPGDSLKISFTALFPDTIELQMPFFEILNFALVQAEFDTNLTNNLSQAKIFIRRVIKNYDLELAKNVQPDTVRQGDVFTYDLLLTNHGPRTASNFILKEAIPPLIKVLQFQGKPPDVVQQDSLFWKFDSLSQGESLRIRFQARVPEDEELTADLISLVNVALVSATRDTLLTNNLASAIVFIRKLTRNYDLEVKKSASMDTVLQGNPVTYSLQIINHGPRPANQITLRDNLPGRLQVSNFTINPDQVSQEAIIWNFDHLAAGDSLLIAYDGVVKEPLGQRFLSLQNTAVISAARDTNDVNNSTTVVVTVMQPADFCITLDRNVFEPEKGQPLQVTFELAAGRRVRLDVYDITGYRITTLADGTFHAGPNIVLWDGSTQSGQKVGSGVYLITFRSEGLVCWKKVILVR